jgi:hypothetical protein
VNNYNQAPQIYAVNSAGHLVQYWYSGTTWYGPLDLGSGLSTSATPAVNMYDGWVNLYGLSSAGHLYQYSYDTAWHGPADIGNTHAVL